MPARSFWPGTQEKAIRRTVLGTVAALGTVLALAACEGGAQHFAGPAGASAFAQFIVIGTGLSMGVQSGGVVYESQEEAWPSLVAQAAGVTFRLPLLRTPGCTPPLVAPLALGVYLSGVSTAAVDSSCAGALDTLTPPASNLALAGATADAALNLTPKIVLNAALPYSLADRGRYPLVLASTQSQVTAMRIEGASFAAVELGLSELLPAATSGLVLAATSYAQTTAYTYVPPALFTAAYAAIADSVQLASARAVLLSVPDVTALYALRPAAEIWADRAELATFGITVNADCATSTNLLFTPARIPALAGRFSATGTVQSLSCTDLPTMADGILTPGDVTTLQGAVTQMNTEIKQLAQQNGWAFADLTGVYPPPVASRPAYKASDELTCVYPYGRNVSLDGIFPSATGQAAIATTVAAAIDAKYGFGIAIGSGTPIGVAQTNPCP
jgi:hypothetical protein